MKTNFFVSILLFLFAVSCSNGENREQNIEPDFEIQIAYEKSKVQTHVHNTMLNDFFQKAKVNQLKFGEPISTNDLDNFIPLFLSYINAAGSTTRGITSDPINIGQIKEIVMLNDAISLENKTITRNIEKDISYLNMFCDEFYNMNSDEINIDNVDQVIKNILNHIQTEYPNLTDDQIKELAFVSSVTYNSYNYWYENAMEWYLNLKENEDVDVKTRGVWKELWGAVKSGTVKWAYADSKGAVMAMSGAGLLGAPVAPATALAGAAVSSTYGAIENFFN